jgi:outer membrane receptor protein involved in Fe transport
MPVPVAVNQCWTQKGTAHSAGRTRRCEAAGGIYGFTKGWTQINPNTGDTHSGNEIASLLLGYPASGSVPIAMNPAWRSSYRVLYLQDDWKIRRNLTLNLGLRYEYETPPVERYNRQNRGFDVTAASPIAAQAAAAASLSYCPACATLTGAYQFADGSNRYPYKPIHDNFSPRIGFAY